MTVRNFSPISIEDLMEKIQAVGDDRELIATLGDDLKVEFDLENTNDSGGLCGYHTEGNGFTYYGMSAGGDWENPVFFLVYWDGKKLRGYVPTEGNLWNTTTKMAYGNDEDADEKNIRKRFPQLLDPTDKSYCPSADSLDSDENLIKADFMARILPPGMKELPKPVDKNDKKSPPRPRKPVVNNEVNAEIDRLRGILQDFANSLENLAQLVDHPKKF